MSKKKIAPKKKPKEKEKNDTGDMSVASDIISTYGENLSAFSQDDQRYYLEQQIKRTELDDQHRHEEQKASRISDEQISRRLQNILFAAIFLFSFLISLLTYLEKSPYLLTYFAMVVCAALISGEGFSLIEKILSKIAR